MTSGAYARIEPRPWSKRLRHRRRDLMWRARLRLDRAYGVRLGSTTAGTACPELSVGTVALGAKYRDWALTMLRSLRGRGAYDGPVYIVTDDASAFAGEQNVCVIVVPEVRARLVAKSCKQLLMAWAREPKFLFIDADVVLTAPLAPWYARMQPYLADFPVLCYSDQKPFADAYHGGIVLCDRPASRLVRRRWLDWVRSGRYEFDQEALAVTADEGGVGHMPEGDFAFMNIEIEPGARPPTFVHITNGMIRKYPEPELRAFLSDILNVERMPASFGRQA